MRNMMRLGASLVLMALLTTHSSAATITAVGAEISSIQYFPPDMGPQFPPTDWGASASAGVKDDFRSTDTQAKAYVWPGNPNSYGNDGYAFYGVRNLDQSVDLGNLISNPTYVSSIALSGPPAGGSQTVISGGMGFIDDPTAGSGPKSGIATDVVGMVLTTGATTGLMQNVLTFTLASNVPFRVGVLFTAGGGRKPLTVNLTTATVPGGDPITTSGIDNYVYPDWYFFDVRGNAGDVFTLALQQTPSSTDTGFSGLVFDSIPEPTSTVLLFGTCAAGMLRRRRIAQ